MKTKHILSLFIVITIIVACATNPFTGKKTIALVPNSQLFPTAFAQYNQVIGESNVITGTKEAKMLENVGQRIANAAERWLDANSKQGYLKDYKWEYKLIKSDQVNAWAMPGGKIAFYTGILPIAANETGIAAIMGHEVAHALANHGQQRMSAGILQQLGAVAGNVAIKDDQTREMFNQAYGIGSQVGVMLPYSRKHEHEADEIGQLLMAIAGYDPVEASELWKRMNAISNGQAPPQFLSTHPHSLNRMEQLKKQAPFAKEEARKFGVTSYRPIVPFE